jgi:hypothetical protein
MNEHTPRPSFAEQIRDARTILMPVEPTIVNLVFERAKPKLATAIVAFAGALLCWSIGVGWFLTIAFLVVALVALVMSLEWVSSAKNQPPRFMGDRDL